ncbi:MAG: L,D-transpeptidase family protein [Mesorhizobium sp.]
MTTRRTFLTGAGALLASTVAAAAQQDDVIQQILGARKRGSWDDKFDAKASSGNARMAVSSYEPIFSQQTMMSVEQAIGQYSNIAAQGGWQQVPATKKLKIGVVDPDVEALRRRLIVTGDLPQSAGMSQSFDSYVDAGLKRFQARHGLPSDGVTGTYTFAALNIPAETRVRQLQVNLERLRNESSFGGRYVLVNIPAAQIEAVEGERVVQRHTAIVGKIDRPTPLLDSRINEIIVNPYWTAPESIIRKDIIPLMRKDPQYLTKNGIRIFGPNGQEIPPEQIDWNTEEAAKFRLRQDPSKINAMSSVKINFPSPENVYMHDTPSQSLFNKLMRFDSSGCVRVQNVRDLVTWILRDTPGWSRQQFEQTIRSGENTPVNVTNPVPVHFKYVSAWANGEIVQFRDDIYAKDGAAELRISTAL